MSTPKITRPCFSWILWRSASDSSSCLASSLHEVPSGDISVMPQAWMTSTSSASSARIIAGGAAEPPITVRRKVENFSLFDCTYCSRPSHTVGTPAEKVTFSCSNSS
ncbi:hypothetical protein FQZ97_801670 [compost metagenome]